MWSILIKIYEVRDETLHPFNGIIVHKITDRHNLLVVNNVVSYEQWKAYLIMKFQNFQVLQNHLFITQGKKLLNRNIRFAVLKLGGKYEIKENMVLLFPSQNHSDIINMGYIAELSQ